MFTANTEIMIANLMMHYLTETLENRLAQITYHTPLPGTNPSQKFLWITDSDSKIYEYKNCVLPSYSPKMLIFDKVYGFIFATLGGFCNDFDNSGVYIPKVLTKKNFKNNIKYMEFTRFKKLLQYEPAITQLLELLLDIIDEMDISDTLVKMEIYSPFLYFKELKTEEVFSTEEISEVLDEIKSLQTIIGV